MNHPVSAPHDRAAQGLPRWGYWLAAILILALAAGMRIPSLGHKSLWVDEVITAIESRGTVRSAIRYAAQDVTPPLSYLFTVLSVQWGDSEAMLRLPACLFGLAGVAALIWVGALYTGRREGGLAAGLLLTLSPFHLFHSQDARMYAMYIAWTLLALGCEFQFWRGWEQNRRMTRPLALWLAGWIAATLANLYTTYFAFFVLAGQCLNGLYQVWLQRKQAKGLILPATVFALGVWVGYLPWLGALIRFLQRNVEAGGNVSGPALQPLAGAFAEFGPQLAWGNALFALAVAAGLVRCRAVRTLALFQLLPCIVYLWAFQSGHFFSERYLAHLLPVLLLAVSAGILFLWDRLPLPDGNRRVAFALYGPALIVLFAGVCAPALARYYRQEKQDWRAVAAFMAPRLESGDRIITGKNSVHVCLMYYFWRQRVETPINWLTTIRSTEQLRAELDRPGRVWLVHAWRNETPGAFLKAVYEGFDFLGSYPARTDWGEIYVFLKDRSLPSPP